MLTELKKQLNGIQAADVVVEATRGHAVDDSIKSIFLDDEEGVVIGAENDPEVEKLVKDLPEYNDEEEVTRNLSKLTESLIETEFS